MYDTCLLYTSGAAQPKSPNDTPVLDNFGTDMTRAAAENRLDPIVGREKEIERLDFKVDSIITGVTTSKSPTYPTHQNSMFSVKLS